MIIDSCYWEAHGWIQMLRQCQWSTGSVSLSSVFFCAAFVLRLFPSRTKEDSAKPSYVYSSHSASLVPSFQQQSWADSHWPRLSHVFQLWADHSYIARLASHAHLQSRQRCVHPLWTTWGLGRRDLVPECEKQVGKSAKGEEMLKEKKQKQNLELTVLLLLSSVTHWLAVYDEFRILSFLSSMILALGNSELSSGFSVLLNVVENKLVSLQIHFSHICVQSTE